MKFAFAVFTFFLFGCAPEPTNESFPEPGNPVIECKGDGCCDLAGRYHLRGRTKKFFGRVS